MKLTGSSPAEMGFLGTGLVINTVQTNYRLYEAALCREGEKEGGWKEMSRFQKESKTRRIRKTENSKGGRRKG